MMTDPVVAIARELEIADRAFDEAAVKRDLVNGLAIGARLESLTRALHSQTPTTPAGAAILLREATDFLEESADPIAQRVANTLNPIAIRLAKGNRRQADLIALRAAQTLACGASRPGETAVSSLIARALRGATATVVAEGDRRGHLSPV